MSIISIILTAIGLSMDAFAVSLIMGLKASKEERGKIALKAGIYFGGFQALMPLVGWLLGVKFTKYIESIDHWIAFFLLIIIGGKMLVDSLKDEEEAAGVEEIDAHSNRRFLILAVATSIDALAVGISCAFLNINIITVISIIGIITFVFSTIAVYIGKAFGNVLKDKAGIIGGIILILIGFEILIDHLELFVK